MFLGGKYVKFNLSLFAVLLFLILFRQLNLFFLLIFILLIFLQFKITSFEAIQIMMIRPILMFRDATFVLHDVDHAGLLFMFDGFGSLFGFASRRCFTFLPAENFLSSLVSFTLDLFSSELVAQLFSNFLRPFGGEWTPVTTPNFVILDIEITRGVSQEDQIF